MSVFAKNIVSLLNHYKGIIRKQLDIENWSYKINDIGLKRQALKKDDDVVLYQKAQKVIEDTEQYVNGNTNSPSWYSGIDEFHQHLKSILADYSIDNGMVVHSSQRASRIIVDAIQLMSLPNYKLNDEISEKLIECGKLIARYGSKEQKKMYSKALKKHVRRHTNFFLPLASHYEDCLSKLADSIEQKKKKIIEIEEYM